MVKLVAAEGPDGHTIVKMAKFKVRIETTINIERTIEAVNYEQALKSLEQKGTVIGNLKVLTDKDSQSISEKIYIVKVDE